MGIEGRFLLRIGDAGVPDNQLQLATSNGNVTDPSWQFETGKWLRCAFTFSSSTGAATLWINGNKKATLTSGYPVLSIGLPTTSTSENHTTTSAGSRAALVKPEYGTAYLQTPS